MYTRLVAIFALIILVVVFVVLIWYFGFRKDDEAEQAAQIGSATSAISGTIAASMPYTGCRADSKAPGYLFCQGKESPQGDIGNQAILANNLPSLVGYCNAVANCKGFNTNGWFKNEIKDQTLWNNWTTDPNKGLYVKQNTEHLVNMGQPMIDPFNQNGSFEHFVSMGSPMIDPFN